MPGYVRVTLPIIASLFFSLLKGVVGGGVAKKDDAKKMSDTFFFPNGWRSLSPPLRLRDHESPNLTRKGRERFALFFSYAGVRALRAYR